MCLLGGTILGGTILGGTILGGKYWTMHFPPHQPPHTHWVTSRRGVTHMHAQLGLESYAPCLLPITSHTCKHSCACKVTHLACSPSRHTHTCTSVTGKSSIVLTWWDYTRWDYTSLEILDNAFPSTPTTSHTLGCISRRSKHIIEACCCV